MTIPLPVAGQAPAEGELILVLNCGSSSIKFALFDAGQAPLSRAPAWNGKVQGIGGAAPTYGETGVTPEPVDLGHDQPYHAALAHIRGRVARRLGMRRLAAVAQWDPLESTCRHASLSIL